MMALTQHCRKSVPCQHYPRRTLSTCVSSPRPLGCQGGFTLVCNLQGFLPKASLSILALWFARQLWRAPLVHFLRAHGATLENQRLAWSRRRGARGPHKGQLLGLVGPHTSFDLKKCSMMVALSFMR